MISEAGQTAKSTSLVLRRFAADAVDLGLLVFLSVLYLGMPLSCLVLFNIWEPDDRAQGLIWSEMLTLSMPYLVVFAAFNIGCFIPALAASSRLCASPGKILAKLRSVSVKNGRGFSFVGASLRLLVSNGVFLAFLIAIPTLTRSAATVIPVMRLPVVRDLTELALIVITYGLALLTDNGQNLYDIITGRLIEDSPELANLDWKARLKLCLPTRLGRHSTSYWKTLVTLSIIVNTLIGTICGAGTLYFSAVTALAMREVDAGLTAGHSNRPGEAAGHFKRALALCPGVHFYYEQIYDYSNNQNESAQQYAIDRLIALRAGASDYLRKARLEAKGKRYEAAFADYRRALDDKDRASPLDEQIRADAAVELQMLELEHDSENLN